LTQNSKDNQAIYWVKDPHENTLHTDIQTSHK
jgi:hypothetical protein